MAHKSTCRTATQQAAVMGFMEQVCVRSTCMTPLLMVHVQLVGALVVQAQAGLVPARISSMVLTRYYARIPFGKYEMELAMLALSASRCTLMRPLAFWLR